MDELMKALSKMKKSDKSSDSKESKMAVLEDLRRMAQELMADDLGEMQKVTVAAKDKEGLKHGLEKAEEILGELPKDEDDDEDEE